ncbi:MAG: short-chain dehydrogenase, partial [Cyanobacteria bacterium REEB65]|nr:short-chain dehydrogenase [Cyanobacteria bacterium REEB65]
QPVAAGHRSLPGQPGSASPPPAPGRAETLKAVYVDTGENGLFSVDEFVAISTAGQMEFVTPEEIARNLIAEVKGDNTGKDVLTSLNIACMGPTYRAGFSRHYLLDKLRRLQRDLELPENDTLAMAFEVLGPPRLSKLLYEAYLLKLCTRGLEDAAATEPAALARTIRDRIVRDTELRKKILSIGIPILLEREGALELLRGRRVAIPKDDPIDLADPARYEPWAEAGWVDLRPENWARWTLRLRAILKEMQGIPAHETSSRHLRDRSFWGGDTDGTPIEPGEVAGWIFNTEDRGQRARD